jgi:hypothetical protein
MQTTPYLGLTIPSSDAVARVTVSTWAGGPPASPRERDIWVATAVDANGTRWMFQYNAGSASAFKWEFVGGNESYARPALANYVNAANAAVFQNTGLILGRAGDYKLKLEVLLANNSPVTPAAVSIYGGIGGVAVFTRQAAILVENGGNISTLIWDDVGAGIAAGAQLQLGMNSPSQPWSLSQVLVKSQPVRVA